MKKTLLAAAFGLASLQSIHALADERPKHFNLGAASFASSVAYDDGWTTETETFGGTAIFFDAAINNNVAFRLTSARQKNENDSSLKLNAIETSVLAGTGMTRRGVKGYGSLGFYNETLKGNLFDEKLSGLMLGGGVGYNWSWVALEFWLNIREASDYESFFEGYNGGNIDAFAVTAGLGLSARF